MLDPRAMEAWERGGSSLQGAALLRLALRPMRGAVPNRVCMGTRLRGRAKVGALRRPRCAAVLRRPVLNAGIGQVNQLEAAALDEELIEMLLDQVPYPDSAACEMQVCACNRARQ